MKRSPTGRIVGQGPSIQNIPVRTPEGAKLKAAFMAHMGVDWAAEPDKTRYVAVENGEIIGAGDTLEEAFEAAKRGVE